jgi:hypothetical protein
MKKLLIALLLAATALATSAQTIRIKGSNTFGEELAPRLIAEYGKLHPDVLVDLEAKGSGSGILALFDRTCDIAASSRTMTEDEMRMARSRGIVLRNHTIGYYGVAVVVHPAHPVKNLTHAQVRDIFTGVVRNWKEVGGPDLAIQVHIRDPISGTYLGFQELAMERKPYAGGSGPAHQLSRSRQGGDGPARRHRLCGHDPGRAQRRQGPHHQRRGPDGGQRGRPAISLCPADAFLHGQEAQPRHQGIHSLRAVGPGPDCFWKIWASCAAAGLRLPTYSDTQ